MKKKQFKVSNNLVIGLIGFAVIAFSAVGLVSAYNSNVVKNFYDNSQNIEAPVADSGDIALGSSGITSTSTPDKITAWYSGVFSDVLWLGNWENTEGIGTFQVVKNFTDATITPIVYRNTYGESIYIRELSLKILGHSTTTARICVTTSTSAFISGDDASYLTENAGTCTLMRGAKLGTYFTSGGNATGTQAFLLQNAGTNTYVATQLLPIEWKPDEYILVYATSSSAADASITNGNYGIIGSTNIFDGKLYATLERIK
jgi:hypothetical protein